MARNVAPNRCSNFDQISTPILTILELQNGTQNHSKISLRAQGPPRARPGPAQRPPESLSGGILGSFWLQFGPSGGSCSSFFGVHVCFFWLAACLLLVLFFSCVLSSFLSRPTCRCPTRVRYTEEYWEDRPTVFTGLRGRPHSGAEGV